jgi:tetratricopeptide (TPR) repeat protein
VSAQYVLSLTEMAKENILEGKFDEAVKQLTLAQHYPHNLGEGKLYGAQENDIFYWLGRAYESSGQPEKAKQYFLEATKGLSEPGAAIFYNDQPPDKIFYQGLAWQKLGDTNKGQLIFEKLVVYGNEHLTDEMHIDYFAVSLPNLLIFEDDLNLRNSIHCRYIAALGLAGLRQYEESEKLLAEVLKHDAMHFGATVHKKLLQQLKEIA